MRRSFSFVLPLFLIGTFLYAQQPSVSPRYGAIYGVVVDTTNSAPVKYANVTLSATGDQVAFEGGQGISATTDDAGRFEFKDIPPGKYAIRAERPSFAALQWPGLRITVRAGQTVRDLVLRLAPGAVITGHVVDEHGQPMASVNVQAMRYVYSPGGRRLQGYGGGTTNDLGEYRIFGLSPGRYYIRATVNMDGAVSPGPVASGLGAEKGPQMRYPATYYAGVSSLDQASLLELRPADQATIDFNFTPVAGVYVRGRLPEVGKGALGTSVVLFDIEGVPHGQTMAHNGGFEFPGVLPGNYTLTATEFRTDGQKPVRMSRNIQVGQTDVNNADLEISPGLSGAIHGQIRVAGESHPDLSQLVVSLHPVEGRQQTVVFQTGDGSGDAIPGLAMVHKDGSFDMAMPNAGPGVYFTALSARSSGLEDFYTKSVAYGDSDITETGLQLPTSPATLELVIAADGATVQGSVIDSKNEPVDGATVVAIPSNPKLRRWSELYQTSDTDQNGHFTLRGVRPGGYRLYAWRDIDPYAFLDPEFMRDYTDRGQALKADANGRYAVVLHALDTQQPGP